jgi:hypothetical protein
VCDVIAAVGVPGSLPHKGLKIAFAVLIGGEKVLVCLLFKSIGSLLEDARRSIFG